MAQRRVLLGEMSSVPGSNLFPLVTANGFTKITDIQTLGSTANPLCVGPTDIKIRRSSASWPMAPAAM